MNDWDLLRRECPLLYKRGIAFACGPGWYNLIRDLSKKIEAVIERLRKHEAFFRGEEDEIYEIFAVQVKEKYGTLRFYMSRETEEISDLIEEAEALSSQTCERCGELGKMRGNIWLEVRCEKCY